MMSSNLDVDCDVDKLLVTTEKDQQPAGRIWKQQKEHRKGINRQKPTIKQHGDRNIIAVSQLQIPGFRALDWTSEDIYTQKNFHWCRLLCIYNLSSRFCRIRGHCATIHFLNFCETSSLNWPFWPGKPVFFSDHVGSSGPLGTVFTCI